MRRNAFLLRGAALVGLLAGAACTEPEDLPSGGSNSAVERRDLFDASAVLSINLRAPLSTLFERLNAGQADSPRDADEGPEFSEPATLTFKHGARSKTLDLRVYVRGQSSKLDCPFPKLKLDFADKAKLVGTPFEGHDKIRLNTHCGPGETTTKSSMGRVMNGVGPVREDLTYRLIRAIGIPTYRTRVLDVHYDDTAAGTQLDTFAVAIESHGDATKRFSSMSPPLIPSDAENVADGDPRALSLTDENVAQIFVAEALAGNSDWGLPGIGGAAAARPTFHNIEAFAIPGETKALGVAVDFDLGAVVQGADRNYRKTHAAVTEAMDALENRKVATAIRPHRKDAELALAEAERSAIAAGAIPSADGKTTTDPGFIDAKSRLEELFSLVEAVR